MRRLLRSFLPLAVALATLPAGAHAAYVASTGSDEHYQLGTGFKTVGSSTVYVPSLVAGAVEVCGAGWWGAARLEDGTVETWGGNEQGQSGTGSSARYLTKPGLVPGLTGIKQLACSGEHIVALRSDGAVLAWGSDLRGQDCDGRTGIGNPERRPYLTAITNAVEVTAGGASTWALRANGTVVGCGEDTKGQLGDGRSVIAQPAPVEAKLSGIKQIDGGGLAVAGGQLLALTTSGTVLGVGLNNYGQLGNGTQIDTLTPTAVKGLSHVRSVSVSYSHALAVTEAGELYAWGDASFGALGAPGRTQCGTRQRPHPCALVPQRVPGIAGVELIDAAVHHSLATSGGRLYGWGSNASGPLGDGTRVSKATVTPAAGPITGVSSISGEGASSFIVTTDVLPTPISLLALSHGLTVDWVSSDGSEPWAVAYRTPGGSWSRFPKLQPPARSYTISGLTSGTTYEVLVQNAGFGARIVTGAAL